MNSFPGIIKRRSPGASRPPASFELAYANDYYEVWRQRDGPTVIEHLPLQRRHVATDRPSCDSVRALAGRAQPRDRLIAASRPEVVLLDPLNAGLRPRGWVLNVDPPGTVTPSHPARCSVVPSTEGGRFRVWMQGSFGRPTAAYVDGRKVGEADEINTPGQWEQIGGAGARQGHPPGQARASGALAAPGDAWRGVLGPVALERGRRKRDW